MNKLYALFLVLFLSSPSFASISTSGSYIDSGGFYKSPDNYCVFVNGTKAKRYTTFSNKSTASGPNVRGQVFVNLSGMPGTTATDIEFHYLIGSSWKMLTGTAYPELSAIATRASQTSVDSGFTAGAKDSTVFKTTTFNVYTGYIKNSDVKMSTTGTGLTLATIEGSAVLAKQATVAAIPTNPLLATDTRLNHLDADISGLSPVQGAGDVTVNENTGGTNALRATYGGIPRGGIIIKAFLTSDYNTGHTTDAYLKGKTYSKDDGTWSYSLQLTHGLSYKLIYIYNGASTTTTITP